MRTSKEIEAEAEHYATRFSHNMAEYIAAVTSYIAGRTKGEEEMKEIKSEFLKLLDKTFVAGRSETSWAQFRKDNHFERFENP